jgi:hypothetical protein
VTFEDEHRIETYKSLIKISVEGFKALLLINAGAIVALLAYLGQATNGAEAAKHASQPLLLFVLGTSAAALLFFGSYFTQFFLYNESLCGKRGRIPHMWVVYSTGVCALLSVVFFLWGAWAGISMLSSR